MRLKFKFPPTINADGSIQIEPIGDDKPKAPNGYEKEGDVFVPLWPKCNHREMKIWPKACGSTGVTMLCRCHTCPLFGRIVKLESCEDCTEVG